MSRLNQQAFTSLQTTYTYHLPAYPDRLHPQAEASECVAGKSEVENVRDDVQGESPYKGKTGLRRLLNAMHYSLCGLAAAARHEDAFRVELALTLLLAPVAMLLGRSGIERALLLCSLLVVLIVELVNSAIEATVDRISLENHRLAKRAKDMGSAAVMLSLITAGAIWLLVLFG